MLCGVGDMMSYGIVCMDAWLLSECCMMVVVVVGGGVGVAVLVLYVCGCVVFVCVMV